MFEYFLIGMKTVFSSNILIKPILLLALFMLLIEFRRLSITIRSGGDFLSPFKIRDGYLYIHSGMVPGERKFLLKDIKEVTIHLISGVRINGDRYHIELTMKNGRSKSFFVGKDRKNVELISEMKKELNRKRVKVYYYDYSKK